MLLTLFASQLFGQQADLVSSNEGESSWGEPPITSNGAFAPTLELGFAPNPFAAEMTIKMNLPESGKVSLKVYDVLGQEVETIANEYMSEGQHVLKYLGSDLPAGRYYLHLNAVGKVLIRPVLKRN